MEFQGLLREWSEGDYTSAHPAASAFPFGGLFQTIGWSVQAGETKQSELIGMSAVAEIDLGLLASRHSENEGDTATV
eukprot:SAG31_NODE_8742_length_1396_cov_1.220509_2_plen_77_part_00